MTLVQFNTFSGARFVFPPRFQTFIVHKYFLVNDITINNLKPDSTVHKLFNSPFFNVGLVAFRLHTFRLHYIRLAPPAITLAPRAAQ